MNNLKRVFSLALATVMVIGMMVVGASATDFVDDGDITNKTAVDTMTALGIITGIDDAFKPNSLVTRVQMAQMIAKSLNGGKLPEFGLATKGTFSDVPATFWGAEAIEYCASLHIVGGYGDGTFKPNQNVTGQEAAKMMLVALGYDEGIFGFTGANWAANVDYYADNLTTGGDYDKEGDDTTSVSMYAGVDARALPLTRDAAAQLIYNGLNANTVTSKVIGVQNGAPLYEYNMYNKPLLVSKFNATVAEVTLKNSKYDAKTGTYTYNVTDPKTGLTQIESAQDVTEAFLQKIRVVFTGKATDPKVLAVSAVTNSTNPVAVAAAELKENAAKTVVTLDGRELANASGVDVYTFNKDTKLTTVNKDGFASADVKGWHTYSAILDAEGKVAAVVVYPTTVAAVTEVKDGKVKADVEYTIEDAEKPENVNAVTEDELAKGDYVLVSKADNLLTKLEKLSLVENVTATAESKSIYTIGGEKYSLGTGVTVNLGETYNLVVVNGYVMAAVDPEGNVSSALDLSKVLYTVEVGKEVVSSGKDELGNGTDSVHKVRAVFTDGTNKVIDVINKGADSNGKPTPVSGSNMVEKETLYTFTEKDGEYSLMPLVAANLGFTKTAKPGTIAAGGKVTGNIRFANDAVLFVTYKKGTESVVEVMTGADINGWKTNATVESELFAKDNTATGLTTVGFGTIVMGSKASVAELPGAAAQPDNYGYVVSDLTNVWNPDLKKAQMQVTVWNGTENVTYYTEDRSLEKGDAIRYSVTDGVISVDKDLNGNKDEVIAYDGETIIFKKDSSKAYSITDDTKIIFIDTVKFAGQTTGSTALADLKNVYFEADDAADKMIVKVLFVDVNK